MSGCPQLNLGDRIVNHELDMRQWYPVAVEKGKCYIRMNKLDFESLQSDKASAAVLHLVWGNKFQGRCGPASETEEQWEG